MDHKENFNKLLQSVSNDQKIGFSHDGLTLRLDPSNAGAVISTAIKLATDPEYQSLDKLEDKSKSRDYMLNYAKNNGVSFTDTVFVSRALDSENSLHNLSKITNKDVVRR